MLQADGAVAQHHQRLAGGLEVAMGHADRGFLVGAGDELRLLVAAVVDQRFVQPAEARGRVRADIVDVERLDDVDHEVRAVRTMGLRDFLRDAGLGRRDMGVGPQRRRAARRGIGNIGARRRGSARGLRGDTAPAAPATATPAMKLRRLTFGPVAFEPVLRRPLRAIYFLLGRACLARRLQIGAVSLETYPRGVKLSCRPAVSSGFAGISAPPCRRTLPGRCRGRGGEPDAVSGSRGCAAYRRNCPNRR